MPKQLIRSIPTETGSVATADRPLPRDLLRDASRRLGILSLVACALWTVGTVLYHVSMRVLYGRWLFPMGSDVFVVIGAASSAALYTFSWRDDRDPRQSLDLGLFYMVVTSFLVGMMMHWEGPRGVSTAPAVSWIGAVVLIFAAIVPSTPGKTAVASFIAVSMNPVSMLVARARGTWDFGHPSQALLMHYPDFLLAGVAIVISHVMTRLGQQVAKARDLGSYELGELIGRGGMGEVYRARHRMLARPAAVKLMRAEMLAGTGEAGRLAVSRFRREAEAAARLQSPHTVGLYDFGVTEDRTFYFVMELLEGLDLETLVKRFGPVPPARVVYLLRQVCESLEEAHVSGLIHRDIKPANIHVGRLGLSYDFVKVLDFGLVKSIAVSLGDGGETASLETAIGLTPGTPAYMAPEAALGEALDGRSDLYALGCVAYFLLTGRRVFEGNAPLQIVARHVQETPRPPSEIMEAPLPAALEQLVLACLAKSPADRPQRARDIAHALDQIDAGEWNSETASEWWRQHGT